MLRLRTGYSFRRAVGGVEEILEVLSLKAGDIVPITDTASSYGWVAFDKAVRSIGAKPAFGVELAVSPDPGEKRPRFDHWTFFPRGQSLRPLNSLVELATSQFRYQPLLRIEQALAATEALSVVIGSRTPPAQFKGCSGTKGLYCAAAPSVRSKGFHSAINALGIPWAASGENFFPRPQDRGFYEVVCGRGATQQTYAQHILASDEDWAGAVGQFFTESEKEEALANSRDILRKGSRAQILKAALPSVPVEKSLEEICIEGARDLGLNIQSGEYARRFQREIRLIREKGFEGYFQIVTKIVQWARGEMIVGPARGSSCGSLVCYLLRITTVDPLKHGLLFERFVDVNRHDFPDIDIDFSDQNRFKVIDFIKSTWGEDKVANLGTVALYRPRSSLKECAGALGISPRETSPILDSLILRSSGDARALDSLEDTFKEMPLAQSLLKRYPGLKLACRMEGHPRHSSTHASGVIVSNRPLLDFVPLDARNGLVMLNKADAEALDMMKIDVLGLTQLSILEDALELAGLPRNHLETLELDDKGAFSVLNKRAFSGVFQFNGLALQSLAMQVTTEKFDDIVSLTALGRPGPLTSGNATKWIMRRKGTEQINYTHPIFEPYVKDTLGIVLYQEQVMEIGRNVGDLSWEQVTALRKAMSKSLGKEFFDQFGDPWKKAAVAKGVPPKDAEGMWDNLCDYGSWAFNKSHSVAYALISYWCLWVKAYYPLAFFAATLNHQSDIERQRHILREAQAEAGARYRAFDAEESTDKWRVAQRDGHPTLIGPLQNVKGIGPKTQNAILSARARGERLTNRCAKLLENGKTDIDTLWPIRDAVKAICPNLREKRILTPPTEIITIMESLSGGEIVLVIATPERINVRDENETINIVKRGGTRIEGRNTKSLVLRLRDDTGIMIGKVNWRNFHRLGTPIVRRGRANKALYAFKGSCAVIGSFRMLNISAVRYLGDIEDDSNGEN